MNVISSGSPTIYFFMSEDQRGYYATFSCQQLHDTRRIRNVLRLTARQRCGTSSTRDTARLLEKATSAFIPSIMWPLYSPDINPVEYKIWGTVQQRVYHSRAQNVDEQRCLRGLEQNIIESTTSELCGCFKAFVQPKMDISNNCLANINNLFNH